MLAGAVSSVPLVAVLLGLAQVVSLHYWGYFSGQMHLPGKLLSHWLGLSAAALLVEPLWTGEEKADTPH
jgi:hypothetical protein